MAVGRRGQVVVKQGSAGRAWTIVLDEPDPSDPQRVRRRPVDLTLLDGAELRYKRGAPPGTGPTRGGSCVIVNRRGGELSFAPGPEDTAQAGEYAGVLSLTWQPSAGIANPEIVPNRGYLAIVVEPV
jgi:hypothetical protein